MICMVKTVDEHEQLDICIISSIYYMAELVHGVKGHSHWFPERSEFCYTDL